MVKVNRTKGDIRILASKEEFNTLVIAMALLNIQDMDDEAKEQGLETKDVVYNHMKMFEEMTKVSKLYPKPDESVYR